MSSAVFSPSEQAIINELDLTTTSTSTLEASPKYSPPVLSTPGSVNVDLINKQLIKIQTSVTDGTAQIMAKLSSMNMKGGAFNNPNINSRMKGGGLFDGVLGNPSSSNSSTLAPKAPNASRNARSTMSRNSTSTASSGPTFANRFASLFSGGPAAAPAPQQGVRSVSSGSVVPKVRSQSGSQPGYSSTGGYRRRSTRKSKRSGKKSRRASSK